MSWRRPQRPLHAVAAFCASLRNLQAAARPSWRRREGERSFPAPQEVFFCGSAGWATGLVAPQQGWGWRRAGASGTCCPASPGFVLDREWCHETLLFHSTLGSAGTLGSTGSLLATCCWETPRCLSCAGPNLAQCFGAFTSECLLHLAANSSFYYIRALETGRKHPGIDLIARK